MNVKLAKLNEIEATSALRHAIRWAICQEMEISPFKLRAMLADLLSNYPIEHDLVCRAIELNAMMAISAATTKQELKGVTESIIRELVRRHVSNEGAVFAVTVIVKVVRRPETTMQRQKRRWNWFRKRSVEPPARVAPPAVSTLQAGTPGTQTKH